MPVEDEQNEPRQDQLTKDDEETQAPTEELPPESPQEVSNQSTPDVADVSGEGEETHATAYSVTLRGRTDASFSSSFSSQGVTTTPGTGCNGCAGSDCVHVRGTLASTFNVATRVTLPSVDDFPNLTPCQRQRVQDGITNVLAPHEQQHVSAFNTYNGTSAQSFDMTICRGAFDAAMQRLHDTVDNARQSAARALSNALDPFQFDVDINCEEPRDAGAPRADAGAPAPQATTPGEEEMEA
jgi:hypothetical protein